MKEMEELLKQSDGNDIISDLWNISLAIDKIFERLLMKDYIIIRRKLWDDILGDLEQAYKTPSKNKFIELKKIIEKMKMGGIG
jgi:hypothetical protein